MYYLAIIVANYESDVRGRLEYWDVSCSDSREGIRTNPCQDYKIPWESETRWASEATGTGLWQTVTDLSIDKKSYNQVGEETVDITQYIDEQLKQSFVIYN
jgi:hypothetical protein